MAKTGDAYTLSGPALIAADGVESLVRGQLGVALEGEQAITYRFSRASVGTKSNSRSSIRSTTFLSVVKALAGRRPPGPRSRVHRRHDTVTSGAAFG